MVFISAVSLLAWAAWALLTYQIGVRLMPEADTQSDVGELLRTIGFSAAPGMLRIFGIVPGRGDTGVRDYGDVDAGGDDRRGAPGARLQEHGAGGRRLGLGWALAVAIAVGLGLVFGPTVS